MEDASYSKLKIDHRFRDFSEFESEFNAYKDKNKYIFTPKHSTLIDSYNKKLKSETSKLPDYLYSNKLANNSRRELRQFVLSVG